jgi:cupin fold WbuC family metalloprotein
MDGVQRIDRELLERTLQAANRSERLRTNHNFHRSFDEHAQRFLNVLLRGSYVRPHRHLDPPKPESFLVVRGTVAFFLFDEDGRVLETHMLGDPERPGVDAFGIDVAPGLFHTLAAVSEHAVLYEVKPGPYEPAGDKDFATFAPAEGTPEAQDYLAELLSRVE